MIDRETVCLLQTVGHNIWCYNTDTPTLKFTNLWKEKRIHIVLNMHLAKEPIIENFYFLLLIDSK